MKHRIKTTLTALATLVVLLVTGTAVANDGDIQALVKRLASLRSQVEELSAEVDTKKADIDARLQSIRSQNADVEIQIQREKARLDQLRKAVAGHRERIEAQKETQRDLEPAVLASVSQVREVVDNSLPFKRAERLAELDELEKQLADDLISAQKATSRLWQFVEDELRLARENGLYRQVVEVDGQEVLADVARVGMVAIYFKTEDGRLGMARPSDDGWRWQELTSESETEQVRHLFESFEKNIRVGYFDLPNALPAPGGAK